jgi:hypothetical protein
METQIVAPATDVWPIGQGSQKVILEADVTLDQVPALQSTHIQILLAP